MHASSVFQVEHFENWAQEAKVKVMRPNTMNNYGAVLDDIGMEGMLNDLMTRFINPIAAGLMCCGLLFEIFLPDLRVSALVHLVR